MKSLKRVEKLGKKGDQPKILVFTDKHDEDNLLEEEAADEKLEEK